MERCTSHNLVIWTCNYTKVKKLLKQVRGQKQVREWKQVKDGAKGSLYVE